MRKTKNKILGTNMIAIYNKYSEFCYANNHQHTHSYRSYKNQLCSFILFEKVHEGTLLSIHRNTHHMNFTKSTKVKEMERKYCLENPPGLAGKNNHLL
jgi:hypothetical protein